MKKLLAGLMVLSFLFIGSQVQASTLSDLKAELLSLKEEILNLRSSMVGTATTVSGTSLEVTYPNGGQAFTMGNKIYFSWSASNLQSSSIKACLVTGSATPGMDATCIPGTEIEIKRSFSSYETGSSYVDTATASSPIAEGNYKIKLRAVATSLGSIINEYSDSSFKISKAIIVPTVINLTSTNVTKNSATLGATVASFGFPDYQYSRGVCYNVNPTYLSFPTNSYGTTCVDTLLAPNYSSQTLNVPFTVNVSGLKENTTYYFIAYARNSATGIGYAKDSGTGVYATTVRTFKTGSTTVVNNPINGKWSEWANYYGCNNLGQQTQYRTCVGASNGGVCLPDTDGSTATYRSISCGGINLKAVMGSVPSNVLFSQNDTFSAKINNTGSINLILPTTTLGTPGHYSINGFPNRFRISNAFDGKGTVVEPEYKVSNTVANHVSQKVFVESSISAGSSATITGVFSFVKNGPHSIQVCADQSSVYGDNWIKETDDNDNCSPWVNFIYGSSSSQTPINGGWTAWSPVNNTCGITYTQTRACTNPTPANGGATCQYLDGGNSTRPVTNPACSSSGLVVKPTINYPVVAFSTSETGTTANLGATVTSLGNSTEVEKGVCYNLKSDPKNPNLENGTCLPYVGSNKGVGPFVVFVEKLIPNSQYKMVGYAKNSAGVSYTYATGQGTSLGSLIFSTIINPVSNVDNSTTNKPDLIGIMTLPANGSTVKPLDGSRVSFSAVIKNQGLAAADSTLSRDAFYNNFEIKDSKGSIILTISSYGPGGYLPAGRDTAANVTPTYKFADGNYSVQVCADQEVNKHSNRGYVDEGVNEGNNCSGFSNFTVSSGTTNSNLPNLIPSFSTFKNSHKAGQQGYFSVIIKNIGTGKSINSFTNQLKITDPSGLLIATIPSVENHPIAGPTGSILTSFVYPFPSTLSSGKYKGEVCVDSGNTVIESVEGEKDNCINGSFDIISNTSSGVTSDATPRIMYWTGKINQYVDNNGAWVSDPNGVGTTVSYGELDKLTYCKMIYPNTLKIEPYKQETVNTWQDVSRKQYFTNTLMSYKCVQSSTPVVSTLPDLVISGKLYKAIEGMPLAGHSLNIFATVLNKGGNVTTSFKNHFEFKNSWLGSVSSSASQSIQSLASNQAQKIYVSKYYGSKGWYYVRACADQESRSNDDGTIKESSESNCSNWYRIKVASNSTDVDSSIDPNGAEDLGNQAESGASVSSGLFFGSSPFCTPFAFTRNMSMFPGSNDLFDKNQQVHKLQLLLMKLKELNPNDPFLKYIAVTRADGQFGSNTKRAVDYFQSYSKLGNQTGNTGPLTRAALNLEWAKLYSQCK